MPKKLNRQAISQLLGSPETHATTLHFIILNQYGLNALYPEGDEDEWPTSMLFDMLEEDFKVELLENSRNKIQALQTALLTDGFFTDGDAFRGISMGLFDGDVEDAIDGLFEDLNLAQVLWAVYEVGINLDEETPLSPGIQRIIAVELAQDLAQGQTDVVNVLTVEYLQLLKELQLCGFDREELESLLPTPFFMQLTNGQPLFPQTV